MKVHVFLAIFLLSVLNLNAQKLEQLTDKTSVNFKIKNMGFTVQGKFKRVTISSNFNSNNLENSFINAVISVNSIDTDNKKRDKHLINKDFFETATYPSIKLTSTKINKISAKNYQLTGTLTIKNVSKKIVVPLQVVETVNSITIQSSFSVNRLDYGVGKSSWTLSDTVKIQLVYTAKK